MLFFITFVGSKTSCQVFAAQRQSKILHGEIRVWSVPSSFLLGVKFFTFHLCIKVTDFLHICFLSKWIYCDSLEPVSSVFKLMFCQLMRRKCLTNNVKRFNTLQMTNRKEGEKCNTCRIRNSIQKEDRRQFINFFLSSNGNRISEVVGPWVWKHATIGWKLVNTIFQNIWIDVFQGGN